MAKRAATLERRKRAKAAKWKRYEEFVKSVGGTVYEQPSKPIPKELKVKRIGFRKYSYKDFYSSDSWRQLRYQALKLHGGACQCCGATRKHGAVLHVDHIKPKSKYPELALDINNLQVLCEACNLGKSNLDDTDWR